MVRFRDLLAFFTFPVIVTVIRTTTITVTDTSIIILTLTAFRFKMPISPLTDSVSQSVNYSAAAASPATSSFFLAFSANRSF